MAWNVFKFCTGLKVIGSVMIVVVLGVVGVSYYAVIIFNYAPHLIKGGSEAAIALIVIILFHVLVTHLPPPHSLSHKTHTQTATNVCGLAESYPNLKFYAMSSCGGVNASNVKSQPSYWCQTFQRCVHCILLIVLQVLEMETWWQYVCAVADATLVLLHGDLYGSRWCATKLVAISN
jgi:hypothetical protein